MKKLLLALALLTASAAHASPIDTLQAGHWAKLPGTSMSGDNVFPSPQPYGQTAAIIAAWTSAQYDIKRRKIVLTGGGDGDYAGNEVYTFDMNTLQWSRVWGPTTITQDSCVYNINKCTETRDLGSAIDTTYISVTKGTAYPLARGAQGAAIVFVQNVGGSITYTNGVDYQLEGSSNIQIRIINTGSIVTGQNIEVRYQPKEWGPYHNKRWQDVYADSMPRAVHTYDGVEYLPNVDRCWLWSGSTYSSGSAYPSSWFFNDSSNTWQRRASANIAIGSVYLEAVSGYDPVTGHVFSSNAGNGFYEFDPVNNTWTTRLANQNVGSEKTGTVDPVRRRFIAVGGRPGLVSPSSLVYSYDISNPAAITRTDVTSLCTGDTAILHTRYPSVIYDPVADRIVLYSGGGTVYTMDKNWVITAHNSVAGPDSFPRQRYDGSSWGGVSWPAVKFGPQARLMYIGDKNAYALVDATTNDVWIYKLPVISRIDMQLQKWRTRPLPAAGVGPGPDGSKHMRLTVNENNGRIYFCSGDYATSSPGGFLDSYRQEIYSYGVKDSTWVQEHGYCPVGAESIPRHPDEVGWVWDSKRQKFWMIPGITGESDSTNACSFAEYRQSVAGQNFTWDPTTKLWTIRRDVIPNPHTSTLGDNGWAVYDGVTDKILQFSHPSKLSMARLNLATNTWDSRIDALKTPGNPSNGAWDCDVSKEYVCFDRVARKLYMVDANSSPGQGMYNEGGDRLLVYNIDAATFDTLAFVPGGVNTGAPEANGRAQTHPVWDSVNRVILWLDWCCEKDSTTSRMLIYHPDTNQWELDDDPKTPDGRTVFGNEAVFDSVQNVMIVYGGVPVNSSKPFFMYRYGVGYGMPYTPAISEGQPAVPGVTVSAISNNTTEAGATATFTAVLDVLPTASVTIPISSSQPAEGSVSVSSITFTTVNWDIPQTVTVTGQDDAVDDGNVAYSIVTGTCTGATEYTTVDPADVAVTNIDNDTRGVTVGAISGHTTEAGGTATFTVVLDTKPTGTVVIGLTSDDTSEGTISPASLSFTTGLYSVPQTVTLTGVDDALSDGDITYHAVTAACTGGDYAGLNPADVTVINNDDDFPWPPSTGGFIVSPDSMRANKGIRVGGQLVNKILRASATLDFNLSAVTCEDKTINVPGAAVGDEVILGIPNDSIGTDVTYTAWVSATDTVTVRACDGALTGDPASGTFKVTVVQ